MAVERKFIRDRMIRLRVKEWIRDEVKNAGFGGLDIVRTPLGTQVSLFVERPGLVIGRGGRRIKILQEKLKDFGLDNPQLSVDEVKRPEFNAQLMASLLARALERGWYFRRAGYRFLYRIMEAGAKGCLIEISGKLVSERARTEKFMAGTIVHTGDPAYELVDKGFDVAIKKLGAYGVSVKIIPPDIELPDEFRVKDVSKEELEEIKRRVILNEYGRDKEDEQRGEVEKAEGT